MTCKRGEVILRAASELLMDGVLEVKDSGNHLLNAYSSLEEKLAGRNCSFHVTISKLERVAKERLCFPAVITHY